MEEIFRLGDAVHWKEAHSTDDPRSNMKIIAIAKLKGIQQAYCGYDENGRPIKDDFSGRLMIGLKKDWFALSELQHIEAG